MKSLEVMARDFTTGLKIDFAGEISRRPRDFKKQVLRLIRRELPPRPGRPNDPKIEAALALLRQGRTIRQVLRSQVQGFDQLDTYGRYLVQKALRQAIARRRRKPSKPQAAQNGCTPPLQSIFRPWSFPFRHTAGEPTRSPYCYASHLGG